MKSSCRDQKICSHDRKEIAIVFFQIAENEQWWYRYLCANKLEAHSNVSLGDCVIHEVSTTRIRSRHRRPLNSPCCTHARHPLPPGNNNLYACVVHAETRCFARTSAAIKLSASARNVIRAISPEKKGEASPPLSRITIEMITNYCGVYREL